MPIHDWTRVSAGTWHDFHLAWIAEIRNCLNGGLLPPDYYAQAEQVIGTMGPDVLTLREPKDAEILEYARRRRLIRIRHNRDDHTVAMIEIISPIHHSTQSILKNPQVAYIEPTAVGKALVDMPLFLTREFYVSIPLEDTYQRAYQGVPRRWRAVLEGETANNSGDVL